MKATLSRRLLSGGMAACMLLSACGGGGGGTGSTAPSTYTITGSVSGLAGSGLVLENNAGSDVSISSNGSFVFSTPLMSGAAYSVTVKNQPTNLWQTCGAANASGTIAATNVTNVAITCVTNTYAVGGLVTGLAGGGLTLQDNSGDDLTVAANGTFVFPSKIASGGGYAVSIKTQPTAASQTCTATNGTGAVAGADITSAAITCVTNTYSIGVSVSGLVGSGLILQDNGADNLGISGNGSFTFAAPIASGANYAVTILTQPTSPAQICSVGAAGGPVTSTNVSSVAVTCAPAIVQCGSENGTIVQHASNVSADETWAGAGTVHLITSTINVNAPATLTIQKCAIVKLKSGVQIVVSGDATGGGIAKLIAAGDDVNTGFITFTNADANAPWGSLEGVNQNSLIELDFAQIRGGGNVGGQNRNATIAMQGTSVSAPPDPVLKVNQVSITAAQGAGIYLDNAAFTGDSQKLTVSSSPDYPIALTAMAVGSVPTYTGQANSHDEALIIGNANIFGNLTIHQRLPIHFVTAGVRVAGAAPLFTPDITLTLDAGVVLKFERASTDPPLVTFGNNGQSVDENAALIANGTPANPVVFTSGAANPAPGDWAGIWLLTSNRSQLQNVIIEYAGGDASVGPVNCGPYDSSINQPARHTAALLVGDGTDQQYVPTSNLITGSTFQHNAGNFAIDSVWENPGRTFGPSLHNDNVFTSPGLFCPQSKNLIPLGCSIGGVDQSGCQ